MKFWFCYNQNKLDINNGIAIYKCDENYFCPDFFLTLEEACTYALSCKKEYCPEDNSWFDCYQASLRDPSQMIKILAFAANGGSKARCLDHLKVNIHQSKKFDELKKLFPFM